MEASTSSWSSPPWDLNIIETHKHIFKIQEFSYLRNCFKNILTLRLLLPSKSVISEDSFLGFLSPELSQIGLRPSLGDDPADPVGCIWKFPKQLYGRNFWNLRYIRYPLLEILLADLPVDRRDLRSHSSPSQLWVNVCDWMLLVTRYYFVR